MSHFNPHIAKGKLSALAGYAVGLIFEVPTVP
jgi:hypothetical protein